ncbi:AAA family ATPase [Pseudomonas sp. NPDC090201]|uniref:AAA family ATPase n=1 Tax=Pseudomonas sp. NPDC090201 TaxID=3364475 RepID=UPI0038060CF7
MSENWLKLKRAQDALEQLRTECLRNGSKMAVARLAVLCDVDRKYFYGHINTPDADLRLRWKSLGDEVRSFNLSRLPLPPHSHEDPLSVEDKLRNALIENYGLVETAGQLTLVNNRLKDHLSQAKEKCEILEGRVKLLEARHSPSSTSNGPIVSFTQKPVVVSPDYFAEGNDSFSRTKAWVAAISELKLMLARPVVKDLYLTIGVPGCGKTTWAGALHPAQRLPLVFDACNLTKSDRYEVLDAASRCDNLRRIAVVFYVPLEVALHRNRQRIESKRVPDNKISKMYASIEYPQLFADDEIFDEIIIVRSGRDQCT